MPHPAFTLLIAILLSLAMAALDERSLRERVLVAARTLLCCAAVTIGGSWLMRLIHG